MNAILPFIIEHWAAISAIIAAIGLRLFPTEKNYDIFSRILKLLDLIVPNIKKGGGRHAAKIILFFALASVSASCYAQLNTTTRLVKFRAGVQNAIDTAEASGNEGNIWYDFVTGRYRANEGGTNTFLIGGSGGEFWPLAGSALVTDDVVLFGGSKTVTLGSITPFSEFTIQSNTVNTFSTIDGGDRTDLIMSAVQFSLTHNGLDGIIQNATGVLLQGASVDANVKATGGNDVNITSTNGNVFVEANSALNLSSANTTILNGSSLSGFYTDVTGTAIVSDAANITLTEGTGVIELTGNIDLQPTSSASELYSGTYTPVGTTSTNTTVVTPTIAQYMRVGNVVTVSGRVDVTFAGAGVARWELSVPIATNFSNQWEGNGTFMKQDAIFGGGIISIAATETVQFSTQASGAGAFSGFCYTYTYQILP